MKANESDPRKLVVKEGIRRTLIEPGEYAVALVDIQPGTFKGVRPRFDFIFEVRSGPFRGERAKAFLNANYKCFSSDTKLHQWWTTAAGHAPENGELPLDIFFKRIFRAKIETKISRLTKKPFSNVTDLLGVIEELS